MPKSSNQKSAQQPFPIEESDSFDHGLLWLDEHLIVMGHNATYRRLLDIDGGSNSFVGKHFSELLQALHYRGEFIESDSDAFLANHLDAILDGESLRVERIRPNGQALSVSAIPLPAGGYVYIHRDLSPERQLRESLRRSTKTSVIAMANMAEHRDLDTGIHVQRVARLFSQTARKLMACEKYADSINETFIEQAATASILHDVGKIATPDQILLKAGPLTPAEREVMQQHTTVGAQLLKQAKRTMGDNPFLDMGAVIAATHHERFDGQGYPHGLAGTDIPLIGRICAVVDVFDALISRRPYKTAWSTEQAMALIQKESGNQFDPDVVAAFIDVINERETVCLVQWTDAMSVGNSSIDDQHRILIDTINQLASAESLNNHYVVSMIIDELLSYAAYHFDFEENLMASANYPDFEGHQKKHKRFVEWVEDFRDDFIIYGKPALGQPVLDFLKGWLSHHIMTEDQRYTPFIHDSKARSRLKTLK